MKYLMLLIFLSACQVKVKSDPIKTETAHIIQSGESYTYIVIKLDFIEQIKQLCLDSNPQPEDLPDRAYSQLVAKCTLDHMNLFNISAPKTLDFVGKYCSPTSDLSAFTPQEVLNIASVCAMLAPAL
jgi:hypothetical protein